MCAEFNFVVEAFSNLSEHQDEISISFSIISPIFPVVDPGFFQVVPTLKGAAPSYCFSKCLPKIS